MEKHRTTCCGSETDRLFWADHLPFFTKFSSSVNVMQGCRNRMQGVRLSRELLKRVPDGKDRNPVLQDSHSGVRTEVPARKMLSKIESDPLGSLFAFLTICRSHESTDPRDKVFAVMGMANACSQETLFFPSYSFSAEVLYRIIASALIGIHPRGLRTILEKEDTDRTNFKTLPSWVPDWSASHEHEIYYEHRRAVEMSFAASGKENPHKSIAGSVLSVKGIEIDTIKAVGDVMESMNDMKEIRTHKGWLRLWKDHNQYQYSSAQHPHVDSSVNAMGALWQTLFGGMQLFIPPEQVHVMERQDVRLSVRRCRPEDLYAFIRWSYDLTNFMDPAHFYCRGLFRDKDTKPENTKEVHSSSPMNPRNMKEEPRELPVLFPSEKHDATRKPQETPAAFSQGTNLATAYQTVRCATMGKRLLITDKGFLGLCPKYSKPGDSIFIIAGLGVPIILRKSQTQEISSLAATLKWQLIGSSYVHGIMNGELAQQEAWNEAVTVEIE